MQTIHRPNINISRRQALVAGVAGGFLLTGCFGRGPGSSNIPEGDSIANKSNILSKTPEYGSAAYVFSPYGNTGSEAVLKELESQGRLFIGETNIENGASVAFLNGGWGILVRERYLGVNHYAVVTLPHVVLDQGYDKAVTMHIPGVGVLEVNDPYWAYTEKDPQKTNSRDYAHVYMSFNGGVKSAIEHQIITGNIAPITPLKTLPSVGEQLAILVSEDDRYNRSPVAFRDTTYTGVNYDHLGLSLSHTNPSIASRNCINSSGKPALQVGYTSSGEVYFTGGAYGSLMLLLNDSEYSTRSGDMTICSPNIVVKPYFPLEDLQ